MIVYGIRHKRTQQLMPEVRTNGGYSHWNPDNPEMPTQIFHSTPRLFESVHQAKQTIGQWLVIQNGRRSVTTSYNGEVDDIIDSKTDGRKRADLEVVKLRIRIEGVVSQMMWEE